MTKPSPPLADRARPAVSRLALSALLGISPIAAAQPPDEASASRAVLRGEANPDVVRTLTAARAAARASDWPEAGRLYVELLEGYPDAVVRQDAALYAGVSDLVLRELAALPREGREACRALVEPRAGALLRDAIGAGDDAALLALLDRYPFAEAAGRSFALLARRALESGRPGEAAPLADRLARIPAEVLPPAGLAALAAALARARDAARLGALEDRLSRDPALRGARLQVAGRGEDLAAFASTQRAALPAPGVGAGGAAAETEPGATAPGAPAAAGDGPAGRPAPPRPGGGGGWPLFGGDPAHARPMDPIAEIPRPLRTLAIPASSARDEGRAREFQVQPYGFPLPPPYFPAVVDGLCILATDRSVLAFNAFLAGGADSVSPPAPPAAEDAALAWRFDAAPPPPYVPDDRTVHAVTVHRGIVYAPLVASVTESEHQLYFYVKYPFPRRALVALDAWTGRALWQVGGQAGAADFLSGASFALPPTPDGDALYAGVTAQQNPTDPFSHYVVCLDAATGRLRWKTFISQGFHEVNLFNNPIREAAGTAVALHGGTLYYGTHLGCVAALDRVTGRIRWVRKYEQKPIPPPRNVHVYREPLRWSNNPPIVAAGTVCLTPLDSLYAYGFDAETGAERWRLEWPGEQGEMWRYLVGVRDGLLFVSGRTLMAIDLAAGGRRRWVFAPAGEAGAGKGGVTEDAVLYPTDLGLHRVDPATGASLAFRPWARPEVEAGNVVSAGGMLFTASASALTIYGDPAAFRAYGEEALARDPENLLLRYRVASADLAAGRAVAAEKELRECLRRAAARQEEPEAAHVASLARRRLFQRLATEALLEARADPDRARRRFAEARAFAEEASPVRELALRLAEACRDGRHWSGALAVYQEALIEFGADAEEGGLRERAVRAIDAILGEAGRGLYAPYEAKARELLAAAQAPVPGGAPVERLAAVARAYPNSLAAREAALTVLEIHERARAWDALSDAARAFLRDYPEDPRAAGAARALAVALEKRGLLSEARRILRQMGARWKGRTVRDGGREVPAEVFAAERLAQPAFQRVADAGGAPELRLPLEPAWSLAARAAGLPAGAPARPILQGRLLPVLGAENPASGGLLLLALDGSVRAIEMASGRVRWEQLLWDQGLGLLPRAAVAVDDVLIVVADARLVGLRARTGEIAWRFQWQAAFHRYAAGGGLFFFAAPETGAPGQTRLVALDPAAGRVAWLAAVPGFPVTDLFLFDDHLALVTNPPGRLLSLDATTGQMEQSTPIGNAFLHGAVFPAPDRFALLTPDGRVQCLAPTTGRTVWETPLEGQRLMLPPGAGGGALALHVTGPRGPEVLALDAATGRRIVSSTDVPAPSAAGPWLVATDGAAAYLLLQQREGGGVILRAYEKTRTLWTYEPPDAGTGTAFFPPTLAREHVVLPLARYDLPNGAWIPRVAVVDKGTGRLVQDLLPGPEARSRSRPQVEVFDGGIAILSDTTLRVYRGK